MTNISSVALLNIQRVHVSAIIESKSTINHNRKLLQVLNDSLKWVSKYIFKCSLILLLIIF